MPLASRLQMIQKEHPALQPVIEENANSRTDMQELDTMIEIDVNAVIDAEPMPTRGGFMIYLDALVSDSC